MILSFLSFVGFGTVYSADLIVYGQNKGLTVSTDGVKTTINIECDNWHSEKCYEIKNLNVVMPVQRLTVYTANGEYIAEGQIQKISETQITTTTTNHTLTLEN